MGGKLSKNKGSNPKYKDSVRLASMTSFSVNEVEALFVLYKKLSSCIVDDGLIHKEEFQLALLGTNEKPNLFADRVFKMFDLKQKGVIDFGEFVQSMSIFHPKTPEADKISFAFKLYDLRHTGYIEREEVKEMLLAILKESDLTLSEDLVEVMLEKTFTEADSKLDGRIDQEEWKEFVTKNPSLIKIMTLPYLTDVTTAFPSFLVNTEVPDSSLIISKHEKFPNSSLNASTSG